MLKQIILLVTCLGLTSIVNSQDLPAWVDELNLSICENDTLQARHILENFEQEHPQHGYIIRTNRALAKLYKSNGYPNKALVKLISAFNYQSKYYGDRYKKLDSCKFFLDYDASTYKADICVEISELFLEKKDYVNSLKYLKLADNEHLPYKGCGNGINMFRSYLTPIFAKHYLQAGDTTRAINRYLEYFMDQDADQELLTQQLKVLLLQKYSQEVINKEIKKGIKNLELEKSKTKYKEDGRIYFTVFGHRRWVRHSYKSLGFHKRWIRKNKRILTLMAE